MERVESFKYLGILLSSDLSWSEHIESICTKASKLLYHKFYKHAEPPALFQLYLSLVRPHLEYASDVWTPPTKGQNTYWKCTLQSLCFNPADWNTTMFKIVHNLIVFPPSIFVPRQSRTGSNAYFQPFAHTNSFLHSLFLALFHCGIHYLVMSLCDALD